MVSTTVSTKYQVVIPRAVREALQMKPGQKLEVIAYEGRIELIPVGQLKAKRGFLKGLDTRVERDEDRV
jgi:AbrB family looped-hinge helix DNA binding protein